MMDPDEMDLASEELVRRGYSRDLADDIASRLDTIELSPDGKWVIRDDDNKIIATIDPV